MDNARRQNSFLFVSEEQDGTTRGYPTQVFEHCQPYAMQSIYQFFASSNFVGTMLVQWHIAIIQALAMYKEYL